MRTGAWGGGAANKFSAPAVKSPACALLPFRMFADMRFLIGASIIASPYIAYSRMLLKHIFKEWSS